MYIALEGIDGSGKDTQLKRIEVFLREKGIDPFVTREPTTTLLGNLIKQTLRCGEPDHTMVLHLFLADMRQHQVMIRDKKWVLSSRSPFSFLAYQSLYNPREYLEQLLEKVIERWPDRVILLDVDPEIALGRKEGMRRNIYERVEVLSRVRENFLALARERGFVVIDGSLPEEEVWERIKVYLSEWLQGS